MRKGYDSVDVSKIPGDAPIVAGYVDGKYNTWPALVQRFPSKLKISITVTGRIGAGIRMGDVENGDMTVAGSVTWVSSQRLVMSDPIVYCNASTWPAVRKEFQGRRVREPLYGIARYDNVAEIPDEWVRAGCIGKQYRDDVVGDLDTWVFADFIPGLDLSPMSQQGQGQGDEEMDREGWITLCFGMLAARDPNQAELNQLMDVSHVTDRAVVLAALDSSDGTAIKNHRRAEAGLK